MINQIVIIGSGNIATCISKAFKSKGLEINQVYSRNLAHAVELAELVSAQAIDDLTKINPNADLYLIAVKDDAIEYVSNHLEVKGIVVHTSGSTPIDVLHKHKKHGVFYPLQTIKKEHQPEFITMPILIEGNHEFELKALHELAEKLSGQVYEVTTRQRQSLHIAAVFANNFTNHMLAMAKQLMQDNELDFELLKPLIIRTALNAVENDPLKVQTGPVMRKDSATIEMHLDLLRNKPTYRQVYEMMSQSIRDFHSVKYQ
ncbi:MAG: DUF2520 domain-containing protein [Bacteroidia bacterium]|jgi:predicted short-subunit dehydrogenase-like oxidoreductase (DUF2520 family)|nr:DUF2520 domain-containing protein [Bacteroidia bacterium]